MSEGVWPEGARCCVCLTFDLDAEWVFMGNDPGVAEMPRKFSQGEYVWKANLIPRILDLLDFHRVKATFFIVGMNAVSHPEVVEEIASRGHDLATHGWKHEKIEDVPKEEERRRLLMTRDAIEDASGYLSVGNRTAGGELSPHTLDILAENGWTYDSSLRGSDLPYRLENDLVVVPSYYEMDDFHLFADYPGVAPYHARMLSPETGYQIWTNAFDGYYKYGLCYTTMFHPQIIGKPGNMMLLSRLLNYIEKYPDVWFATGAEVAHNWG
ncbi:MAG TPA: polysaccharide deacetylase family protein [Patescibacteria group bacterium]|nr:polysaccharide deacetylase family protein [Patescibacteria group bacterium]